MLLTYYTTLLVTQRISNDRMFWSILPEGNIFITESKALYKKKKEGETASHEPNNNNTKPLQKTYRKDKFNAPCYLKLKLMIYDPKDNKCRIWIEWNAMDHKNKNNNTEWGERDRWDGLLRIGLDWSGWTWVDVWMKTMSCELNIEEMCWIVFLSLFL